MQTGGSGLPVQQEKGSHSLHRSHGRLPPGPAEMEGPTRWSPSVVVGPVQPWPAGLGLEPLWGGRGLGRRSRGGRWWVQRAAPGLLDHAAPLSVRDSLVLCRLRL